MEKRNIIIFYLICLALLILSIFFDNPIIKFLSENRIELLNLILIFFTNIGTWIFLIFITIFFLLPSKKRRKIIIPLWISSVITFAITYILKILIMRERPEYFLVEPSSSSFPSGHSTFIFAVLPFLSNAYPKLTWLWFLFAIIIAFSRLYLGMHYLSDVIFGAMLGFGIGLIVLSYFKKYYHLQL